MSTYDAGVANERTALAWQRTSLALVAGAAIVCRLTMERLGMLALVTAGIAGTIGVWLFVESRHRYRHEAGLRRRPRAKGGRSPLALSVAVFALTLTELLALLLP